MTLKVLFIYLNNQSVKHISKEIETFNHKNVKGYDILGLKFKGNYDKKVDLKQTLLCNCLLQLKYIT